MSCPACNGQETLPVPDVVSAFEACVDCEMTMDKLAESAHDAIKALRSRSDHRASINAVRTLVKVLNHPVWKRKEVSGQHVCMGGTD